MARGFRAALFRGLCRCAPFLLRLCRGLTFGFRGSVRRGLALTFGGGLAVCLGGSLAFRLGCGFGGRVGCGLTRGGGSRVCGRLTRSLGRSRLCHAAVEGFDQVGRPVLGAARGVKRQRRSRGDRNGRGVGRRQRRAVRLSLCHGGRGGVRDLRGGLGPIGLVRARCGQIGRDLDRRGGREIAEVGHGFGRVGLLQRRGLP